MVRDHLMVDLETMGTSADCAIMSLGAVLFSPHTCNTPDELRQHSLYLTVSLEDNAKQGRHIDPGTVVWWLRQSQEAREALFDNNLNLLAAMDAFRRFADVPPRPKFIWAKGPTFDIAILKSAFKAVRLPWPFKYWDERCVRTTEDLGFPNPDDKPTFRVGEHHNALDDAITQAMMMQLCYKNLGLNHDNATGNILSA